MPSGQVQAKDKGEGKEAVGSLRNYLRKNTLAGVGGILWRREGAITDRREENDFKARSSGATDEEHPVHQDTCCSCKEKEAKIEQLQSKIRQPFESIVPKDMADELLYQLEKSVEVFL
jgi:hypothetical protein